MPNANEQQNVRRIKLTVDKKVVVSKDKTYTLQDNVNIEVKQVPQCDETSKLDLVFEVRADQLENYREHLHQIIDDLLTCGVKFNDTWNEPAVEPEQPAEPPKADPIAAETIDDPLVEIRVKHRCGITNTRWCEPIGFVPGNKIEGCEYLRCSHAWFPINCGYPRAAITVRDDYKEGAVVHVPLSQLRVVTSGDTVDLGPVTIGRMMREY